MSEVVRVKGRLVKMSESEALQVFPQELVSMEDGRDKCNAILEWLDERHLYESYYYNDGTFYKMTITNNGPFEDYLVENNWSYDSETKSEILDFQYIYYNGGAHYTEILDEAIETNKKK